ncbi:hypothetical protein ACJJIU_08380 [Microbulbifer sp. CnH-101-E]
MLLLLFLHLAVSGQVLAAACASELQGIHTSVVSQQEHCHQLEEAKHQEHCTQQDAQVDVDCDQGCNSCPSHCTTALPSATGPSEAAANISLVTAYRENNSSPAPENAIRPPISR